MWARIWSAASHRSCSKDLEEGVLPVLAGLVVVFVVVFGRFSPPSSKRSEVEVSFLLRPMGRFSGWGWNTRFRQVNLIYRSMVDSGAFFWYNSGLLWGAKKKIKITDTKANKKGTPFRVPFFREPSRTSWEMWSFYRDIPVSDKVTRTRKACLKVRGKRLCHASILLQNFKNPEDGPLLSRGNRLISCPSF